MAEEIEEFFAQDAEAQQEEERLTREFHEEMQKRVAYAQAQPQYTSVYLSNDKGQDATFSVPLRGVNEALCLQLLRAFKEIENTTGAEDATLARQAFSKLWDGSEDVYLQINAKDLPPVSLEGGTGRELLKHVIKELWFATVEHL